MAQNPTAGNLNLVLGHSTRMARNEIQRHKDCRIVCIVSPSPRAARRMDDEGMTETFHAVGTTLTKMDRLEIHFYSTGTIWLPMKALSLLLRNARALQFLLLNGMRLRGTTEDLVELSNVFKFHPSLSRMSFFNINSLQPQEVPLHPLLEGVRSNPVIQDVALRYAGWASPGLSLVTNADSKIQILRLSGKQTVDHDGGTAFPLLMESLKTNTYLKELTLHQSVGPSGCGPIVGEMLRHNKHLESLVMELGQFNEAIPIGQALKQDNNRLKRLDLKFHNTDPSKARPQIWTDLYGNTARRAGGSLRGFRLDSDDSESEEDEEAKMGRLNKTRRVFERAMENNTALQEVRFVIPGGQRQESYNILLYCQLNKAGRQKFLRDDDIAAGEVIDFVVQQNELFVSENDPVTPIDVIWSMLRAKPSLISLLVSEYSKENKVDDDDLYPVYSKKVRRVVPKVASAGVQQQQGNGARHSSRKRAPSKAAIKAALTAVPKRRKRNTN